jgi:hypothetical protein
MLSSYSINSCKGKIITDTLADKGALCKAACRPARINVTFNLANIYGTGVVEMHAGDDGFMMKLGSGGTDISLGRLLSAWEGFKNVSKVIDAKGLS